MIAGRAWPPAGGCAMLRGAVIPASASVNASARNERGSMCMNSVLWRGAGGTVVPVKPPRHHIMVSATARPEAGPRFRRPPANPTFGP